MSTSPVQLHLISFYVFLAVFVLSMFLALYYWKIKEKKFTLSSIILGSVALIFAFVIRAFPDQLNLIKIAANAFIGGYGILATVYNFKRIKKGPPKSVSISLFGILCVAVVLISLCLNLFRESLQTEEDKRQRVKLEQQIEGVSEGLEEYRVDFGKDVDGLLKNAKNLSDTIRVLVSLAEYTKRGQNAMPRVITKSRDSLINRNNYTIDSMKKVFDKSDVLQNDTIEIYINSAKKDLRSKFKKSLDSAFNVVDTNFENKVKSEISTQMGLIVTAIKERQILEQNDRMNLLKEDILEVIADFDLPDSLRGLNDSIRNAFEKYYLNLQATSTNIAAKKDTTETRQDVGDNEL